MIDFNLNTQGDKVHDPCKIDLPFVESPISDFMDAAKAAGSAASGAVGRFNDNVSKLNNGVGEVKKGTDEIDQTLNKGRVDNRSIVARARNSVCQFPCYVTQSCPVTPAQTVSKLFERVYTTLVQTVLAQNPIIDEKDANNMAFLKQFHTNFRESTEEFLKGYERLVNEFYEPVDELDRMMCESIYCEHTVNKNLKVMFRVVPTTNPDLIAECTRLSNDPLTGFVYLQEREETRERTTNTNILGDEDFRRMAADRIRDGYRKRVEDSYRNDMNKAEQIEDPQQRKQEVGRINRAIDHEYNSNVSNELNDDNIAATADDIRRDIKAGKIPNYVFDGANYKRATISNKTTWRDEKSVDAPKVLRDSDIKKMNAMLPYTIEATFRIRGADGMNRDVKYIIGIKTVMHLIRTQDLAEDLREIVTGRIKSLQKVRYKTGEITLMDYLFNPKQLKADAMKNINYNKRWLNTLKRLGDYNQQYGSLLKSPIKAITGGAVPIPNGTIILTQPDVTTLTNQTGIDLSQVSNAKALAKSLFLIAVCIIDASAGTMRVLFTDTDEDWDVQSLAAIDAEVSKTDNSQIMRELNHLVNR